MDTCGMLSPRILKKMRAGEISLDQANAFAGFLGRVDRGLYGHDLNENNPYTTQVADYGLNVPQAEDLFIQFSVFSNRFLVIQCERMVNASDNKDAEREARAILVNECGVSINPKTGNVEGRRFSHRAAHINWLRKTAKPLNLVPPYIPHCLGHWNLGTAATHEFLTRLQRVYGSLDPNIGAGASFAVETWAGNGIGKGEEAEKKNFWKQLLAGLTMFNESARIAHGLRPLNLGFFQYHFDTESGHVASVERELEETFFAPEFDEEKWFYGALEALNATYVLWDGLEKTRVKLA